MDPPRPSDRAIIATNDEAFASKLSAQSRAYISDAYLLPLYTALSPSINPPPPPSRQPMINRGTYLRVTFIRARLQAFFASLPSSSAAQIISFGAGFDTLPFSAVARPRLRYVELDFESVISAKADAIASSPELAVVFDGMERRASGICARCTNGSAYVGAACDLRDLDAVRRALSEAGIDLAVPTIFISECVLAYMECAAGAALINLAAREFSGPRAFVSYEPVRPNDAFGREMVKNVALRGSPLVGIIDSVESCAKRYREGGFGEVDAMDMAGAWELVGKREGDRMRGLEMLDEFEEFNMMMAHYCFVWARAGDDAVLEGMRLK